MKIGVIANLNSPWSRQIILWLNSFGITVHAIEIVSKTQLHYLSDNNKEIQNFKKEIRSSGGKVHQIVTPNLKLFDYLIITSPLKKIYLSEKLQAFLSLYGGGFALSMYLSGIRPFFVYLVGSDVLLANTITRLINQTTYGSAKKIFINGKHLLDSAKKKFQLKNCQLAYIGVDIKKFLPAEQKPTKINLISTRGFLPVYNNKYIIQALSYLNGNDFDDIVFVAGGPELEKIKKLSNKILTQDIQQKIKFLGGVDQDEMVEQLQNSSIFISASKSDGQAISLMEAMACGVFPILSDIPANHEWIKPKWKNGIIVPLGEPKKLAAAIEKAVSDEKLRQNAAKINRQIAVKHFNSEKNLNHLVEEIKKSILEKKGK